jgi:hypothetical protein
MSAVRFENGIRWDGNSLSVWATVNGSRIFCEIPRSTIYNVPLFNDGITREIARDRAEVFNRLRPALIAKIARTRESSIRLLPADFSEKGTNSGDGLRLALIS